MKQKSFKKQITKLINSLGTYFFLLWIITVVMVIGMSFNFHVMMSNGGKMPVQDDYLGDYDQHFSFQDKDEVNNYYLTDIIRTGNMMSSIGDWIMWITLSLMFIVIYKMSVKIYKEKEVKDNGL